MARRAFQAPQEKPARTDLSGPGFDRSIIRERRFCGHYRSDSGDANAGHISTSAAAGNNADYTTDTRRKQPSSHTARRAHTGHTDRGDQGGKRTRSWADREGAVAPVFAAIIPVISHTRIAPVFANVRAKARIKLPLTSKGGRGAEDKTCAQKRGGNFLHLSSPVQAAPCLRQHRKNAWERSTGRGGQGRFAVILRRNPGAASPSGVKFETPDGPDSLLVASTQAKNRQPLFRPTLKP